MVTSLTAGGCHVSEGVLTCLALLSVLFRVSGLKRLPAEPSVLQRLAFSLEGSIAAVNAAMRNLGSLVDPVELKSRLSWGFFRLTVQDKIYSWRKVRHYSVTFTAVWPVALLTLWCYPGSRAVVKPEPKQGHGSVICNYLLFFYILSKRSR